VKLTNPSETQLTDALRRLDTVCRVSGFSDHKIERISTTNQWHALARDGGPTEVEVFYGRSWRQLEDKIAGGWRVANRVSIRPLA
jgi:hypothetical protein